jgi:PiT family inorganic phosphate transporter
MLLSSSHGLLLVTVVVALAFDFLNGFHDAANSIATVVSTRVLSPKLAGSWAAFFNFVAVYLFGIATIGSGMIEISEVTQFVVISRLLGAIVWDVLTWWLGLPTSSSHARIGGYAGAAILRSGFRVIILSDWSKTLSFILIAPLIGIVLGLIFMVTALWLCPDKAPQPVDAWFRRVQHRARQQ